MTNVRQIISKNNETFYDNRSGKRTSVTPRLVLFFMLGMGLLLFTGQPSDDLISAAITVQSILVGFGFSVLFFLVSAEKEKLEEASSIERKLKIEKLNRLSDELFFNVSYYNLVTIFSVVLALYFLLEAASIPNFLKSTFQNISVQLSQATSVVIWLGQMIGHIFGVMFFFILLESIFTFYRIVVRVNFYFSKKLELRN